MNQVLKVTDSNGNGVMKFGVYEVDPRQNELRRNGVKVKLQEQPFQLLTLLLERPGEIVSRDDLQKRLWPSDTFVDFDHSLNAAVRRLRDALGDSADNPRFVETVSRRGYRFLAPVTDRRIANGFPLAGHTNGQLNEPSNGHANGLAAHVANGQPANELARAHANSAAETSAPRSRKSDSNALFCLLATKTPDHSDPQFSVPARGSRLIFKPSGVSRPSSHSCTRTPR